MAVYGLLAFMQARGETAQPFAVDVYVNGALAGRQAFTAAAMTAPDPVGTDGAPPAPAPTASGW